MGMGRSRYINVEIGGETYRITENQDRVVKFLESRGGHVTVDELAEFYGGGRQTMINMVGLLRKVGLVTGYCKYSGRGTRECFYKLCTYQGPNHIDWGNPFNLGAKRGHP